jgi:hypothetical protein
MTDTPETDVLQSVKDTARLLLGHTGRLIAGSKTLYSKTFPKNFVVFNANIVVEGLGKVWHGDLDITRDEALLVRLAELTDREVFVLYEMDGRFEHEVRPKVDKATYKVSRVRRFHWNVFVGEVLCPFHARHRRSGIIQQKTKKEIEAILEKEKPTQKKVGLEVGGNPEHKQGS